MGNSLASFASVGELLSPLTPLIPHPQENPDGKRAAREQAFAIVASLKPRLVASGLSDLSLWNWVKSENKVESRAELSEFQWVVLSARLGAADKDKVLFDVLCDTIRSIVDRWTYAGNCRAYKVNHDGTFENVYEGGITSDISERCQKYADKTCCVVRLHGADGADGIEWFDPVKLSSKPTTSSKSSRSKKQLSRAFEVQRQNNKTAWVEIPFPDCSDLGGWGQQHANETGFDVTITDRMGHIGMQFSATPAPAPPSVENVAGSTDVVVNGQAWVLLNQWENQWHWVKLDRTMERHIATADNREAAVESLVAYIGGGVFEQKKTATEKCGHNRCERCRYGYMSECLSTQEIQ